MHHTRRILENCQNGHYARIGSGSGGTAGLPLGLIARDPAGHAYFLDLDSGVLRPIADGATYLCLARHYHVDWDAELATYRGAYAESSTPATCNASIPDTRPLNRGAVAPPDSAIVLRQPNGTAWVVWGGNRIHIPSGAEFRCWVTQQHSTNIEFDVWDQVTNAQLAGFPVDHTTFVSNCGDPANPTF